MKKSIYVVGDGDQLIENGRGLTRYNILAVTFGTLVLEVLDTQHTVDILP